VVLSGTKGLPHEDRGKIEPASEQMIAILKPAWQVYFLRTLTEIRRG